MVIPILLEKCFANKIYFAIVKRCINCCTILFKHFLSNVQGVPCITFLKAMFCTFYPQIGNWQHLCFCKWISQKFSPCFSITFQEINFHSWMFRNLILTQVSEFCSNFRLQISYAKSYPVQNIPLYLRLICFLNYNCLELWKKLLFISFVSWVIFCKYFRTCH